MEKRLLILICYISSIYFTQTDSMTPKSLEKIAAQKVISYIQSNEFEVHIDKDGQPHIQHEVEKEKTVFQLSDPIIEILSKYPRHYYRTQKNPLFNAIENGDVFGFINVLKSLYPATEDPKQNAINKQKLLGLATDNNSLCFHAVRYGHTVIIKLLLKLIKSRHGLSVLRDYLNIPLLQMVSEPKQPLPQNPSPFQRVKYENFNVIGSFPLHHAVIKKRPDITKILLEHKADPNVLNINGKTPLHYAAEHDIFSLELLLQFNAQVEGKTKLTAYPQTHPVISTRSFERSRTQPLQTPLHEAIQVGHKKAIKLLLLCGASCKTFDTQGLTPFQIAAQRDDLDLAKTIYTHSTDAKNMSLLFLHDAARYGAVLIGNYLLETVIPSQKEVFEIFNTAIEYGQIEFIKMLLDNTSSFLSRNNLIDIACKALENNKQQNPSEKQKSIANLFINVNSTTQSTCKPLPISVIPAPLTLSSSKD